MKTFYEILNNSWESSDSLLCVGLDPDPERIPSVLGAGGEAVYRFNREIIDATAGFVCAFKPQFAYYAAMGYEHELEKSIEYIKSTYPQIPVILDSKRGDIGDTARMYAMEAFVRYGADAVTVNPYMGMDTIEPFLEYEDKGVFLLCRTSNQGSGDFQELKCAERPMFEHVASKATEWNDRNNIGLVVGATYPQALKSIRSLVGDMPMLIPGVGTQGGDLEQVIVNGACSDQRGIVVNVSRAVIFAGTGDDFAESAHQKAGELCADMRSIVSRCGL